MPFLCSVLAARPGASLACPPAGLSFLSRASNLEHANRGEEERQAKPARVPLAAVILPLMLLPMANSPHSRAGCDVPRPVCGLVWRAFPAERSARWSPPG